jgi:hypothetical protein
MPAGRRSSRKLRTGGSSSTDGSAGRKPLLASPQMIVIWAKGVPVSLPLPPYLADRTDAGLGAGSADTVKKDRGDDNATEQDLLNVPADQ